MSVALRTRRACCGRSAAVRQVQRSSGAQQKGVALSIEALMIKVCGRSAGMRQVQHSSGAQQKGVALSIEALMIKSLRTRCWNEARAAQLGSAAKGCRTKH
eukprot:1157583-Pelagomonas_calceolata.AAC.1